MLEDLECAAGLFFFDHCLAFVALVLARRHPARCEGRCFGSSCAGVCLRFQRDCVWETADHVKSLQGGQISLWQYLLNDIKGLGVFKSGAVVHDDGSLGFLPKDFFAVILSAIELRCEL